MRHETFTLPLEWAGFLINGETDELSFKELAAIEDFARTHGLGYCVNCSPYVGFRWSHDADAFWPYGADCAEFTFEAWDK